MNSSREDLIDKYGIIEGFLPLEEQVVYSMRSSRDEFIYIHLFIIIFK